MYIRERRHELRNEMPRRAELAVEGGVESSSSHGLLSFFATGFFIVATCLGLFLLIKYIRKDLRPRLKKRRRKQRRRKTEKEVSATDDDCTTLTSAADTFTSRRVDWLTRRARVSRSARLKANRNKKKKKKSTPRPISETGPSHSDTSETTSYPKESYYVMMPEDTPTTSVSTTRTGMPSTLTPSTVSLKLDDVPTLSTTTTSTSPSHFKNERSPLTIRPRDTPTLIYLNRKETERGKSVVLYERTSSDAHRKKMRKGKKKRRLKKRLKSILRSRTSWSRVSNSEEDELENVEGEKEFEVENKPKQRRVSFSRRVNVKFIRK